jgi:hypothetical protein
VNYVSTWIDEGKERSITPLIQAALRGHADAVRVLMSRGTNKSQAVDSQLFRWQLKRDTRKQPSAFLIMGLMSMQRTIRDSLLSP